MKKYSQSEIENLLLEAGLSITLQRLSLASYILHADHPTAEDILAWAKTNLAKVNTATVYNTLNSLESAKIIKKIKFPHLKHMVYDHNMEEHHHFLDEETGKIFDLEKDKISLSTNLDSTFAVSGVEVLIRGKLNKK